jgi:hypothetical protein
MGVRHIEHRHLTVASGLDLILQPIQVAGQR